MNGGDGTLEWFDCELSATIWNVLKISQVSMKRLLAVKDRFAFLSVSGRRQSPFRRGLKPRGLGASSPQEIGDCAPTRSLCHSFMDEPRSTYPFELRQADGLNPVAGGFHNVAFERRLT